MNNETLASMKARRSIRAYKHKPEQITEEELEAVLDAGMFAPTGMGLQSPRMVIVQDRETRDLLSKLNAAVMGVNKNGLVKLDFE